LTLQVIGSGGGRESGSETGNLYRSETSQKNAATPRRPLHALLDGGTYNGTKLLEQITRVCGLDCGQKDITHTPANIMPRGEQFKTTSKLQQEQTYLANRLAQELNPRASEDQLRTRARESTNLTR
jgi:hypothetical protein